MEGRSEMLLVFFCYFPLLTQTFVFAVGSQGHMQWLWDSEGKRFLDLLGGVVTISVGHCHP